MKTVTDPKAQVTTYTYALDVTPLLNGTGTTVAYDALGRVNALTFPIGTFSYSYDGRTGRVASLVYPNGQTSAYSYVGHAGDHRLQTIHHRQPGGATLSKFDSTYDAVGNIVTWRQERLGQSPFVYSVRLRSGRPADRGGEAVHGPDARSPHPPGVGV